MWAAFAVFERLFIWRDQASARAAFDGHVTDGHATLHRQITDCFAAIFDDIACAACGPRGTDDGQCDVLGGDTWAQFAGDFHLHVFGFFLDQGLRRQNMFHLGRADPVGQRTKCAVCRGVAVTTDNGHTGQCPTLFWANDMHDPLTHVRHGVIMNTEITRIFVQCFDLDTAFFVFDHAGCAVQCGRHVVIRHSDGFFRRAHLAARHAQSFERLGAGHFVNQMAVNIQQAGAICVLRHNMGVPDFIIKGLGGGHF